MHLSLSLIHIFRENELEKFKVKFNEQQYNLQMEYYQQLKERQEEVRSLRHDVKTVSYTHLL